MIVRILTEGQYDLPGQYIDELNDIDNQLVEVVEQESRDDLSDCSRRCLIWSGRMGPPCPLTS